jgi:hypothetical protein
VIRVANGETTMLASKRLLDLIEHNADALTKAWLKDVQGREEMPTYRRQDERWLHERVFYVYSQLGRWISHKTSKEEIAAHYANLGAERYQQGFQLAEVVEALTLTRRHLWLKVLHEGLLDTAVDLYGAMELNSRVVLFFDRAIRFAIQGYEVKRAGDTPTR